MKKVLCLLASIILLSCTHKTQEIKEEKQQIVQYKILHDSGDFQPVWPGGRTFVILINNKLAVDKLTHIADSLIKIDNGVNEIIAVNYFYYTDIENIETSVEKEHYATSFSVMGNLITTTMEEDNILELQRAEESENKYFYGVWDDKVIDATIGIYKENHKYYMEYIYGINARNRLDLDVKTKDGQMIFVQHNDRSTFMKIIDDGRLCLFNTQTNDNVYCYDKKEGL